MKSLKNTLRSLLSFLLLVSAVACANADELSIGAKAPQFSLVNAVDGKTVAFHPGDGKVSVVVFTCNQCPYAKAFEPRIIELAKPVSGEGNRVLRHRFER